MILMQTVNLRQKRILRLIENSKGLVGFHFIESSITGVSKVTLKRDLAFLQKQKLIEKTGSTRDATYSLHRSYMLFKKYDHKKYYSITNQKNKISKKLNLGVFKALEVDLFTKKEVVFLDSLNKKYQTNVSQLEEFYKKREYERLSIEFSWKSSHIEGNTYSYLETEYLLKDNKEPEGHSSEEKNMILNHKKTLDFIFKHAQLYRKLSKKVVLDTHYMLVKKLDIPSGLRLRPVRIGGSSYVPPQGVEEIDNVLLNMVDLVNSKAVVYEKALLVNLLIAYIQPFVDGNKRTSRMMSNAVLLAFNHCPFSLRDLDELKYKEALLLFYEQNSLALFKKIFIEQYQFAVENYFLI